VDMSIQAVLPVSIAGMISLRLLIDTSILKADYFQYVSKKLRSCYGLSRLEY
jgi:hypothetical protein